MNAERLQRTTGDTSYVLEDSAEASVRQACMSNGNIHRSPTPFCSVNRPVQAQEQDDCMSEKGETRRGVGRRRGGGGGDRAQELSECRGGGPGLPVPNSP